MTFIFRAHPASSYSRFTILLLIVIAFNLVIVIFLNPWLQQLNAVAEKSIILIIPWLLLLFLPSMVMGVFIYQSFTRTYRFTIEQNFLTVEKLRRSYQNIPEKVAQKKHFAWPDLITIHTVDFEDNHYCNLEFSDKKENLVIHRDSGEFEKFYEKVKEASGTI